MGGTRLFDRAIVRISPLEESENARAFLQGLVTNDVMGALPTYAGLLSAQGKAMFDFLVWAEYDDLLIDCEAKLAEELVKRLSLYRLRRKLAINLDPGIGVHWAIDSDQGEVDPRLPALGKRWLATASEDDHPADDEFRAHRLSLGVIEGRDEMGDILWLETNAVELNGVSFNKGCYIGQENTARMNWRQKVNRRLVVVPLDRSDEKRRKIAYPDLNLAVDHLRVADTDPDLLPIWLSEAVED
jgi:folate-binding protein YgfZ